MTELHNLSLFFSAIAKFLLMTGLGIGGAVALIAECCGWKIADFGFEKVSVGGQLATRSKRRKFARREADRNLGASDRATSPPRKEWRVA